MGFIKAILQKRKISLQIEKLRMKNEKYKLQNAIIGQKQAKSSKEIKNFLRTAKDIDELKGILDEKGVLLQFLDTQAGQNIVNALIQKFGTGTGSSAALNIGEIVKNLTPEQKAKGLALLKEVVGGAD